MKRVLLVGIALVLGAACDGGQAPAETAGRAASAPARPALPPAPRLAVSELLSSGAALAPSPQALALAGQRVRLAGYMAQMELPPTSGFMLSPRPVHCDEAGGGTADLPPESVLVLPPAGAPSHPAFVPGPLEVTGILEVGNQADQDGHVSAFRLRPEKPQEDKP